MNIGLIPAGRAEELGFVPSQCSQRELVELFPGHYLGLDAYRRLRRFMGCLAAALALLILDRLHPTRNLSPFPIEPAACQISAPPLPSARLGRSQAKQIELLKAFQRARGRATDIVQFAAAVTPSGSRIGELDVATEGSSRSGSIPQFRLRLKGTSEEAEAVRTFVDNLRVVVPTAHLVALTAPATDGGPTEFGVDSDPGVPEVPHRLADRSAAPDSGSALATGSAEPAATGAGE